MKSLLVLTCLVAVCFVATNATSVDTRALEKMLETLLEKRRKPKPKECDASLAEGNACDPADGTAGEGGECKPPRDDPSGTLGCVPSRGGGGKKQKGPPRCAADALVGSACTFGKEDEHEGFCIEDDEDALRPPKCRKACIGVDTDCTYGKDNEHAGTCTRVGSEGSNYACIENPPAKRTLIDDLNELVKKWA